MTTAGWARDTGATGWIVAGLATSVGWGVATAVGAPPAVALGLVAVVAAVVIVARRDLEIGLLAVAATVVAPLPDAVRPGLLVGTVAVIALLTWRSGLTGLRLGRAAGAVLAGVLGMIAVTAYAAFRSDQAGELPAYLFAALVTTVLFVALTHRARVVGPQVLAGGIALASLAASVIVIARLGGLPLVGSSPRAATYSGAKDSVIEQLGDVNGQSLIVMLGLPILLAFALHLGGRQSLLALGAAGLAALALVVLLSRSSLLGGAIGCALVLLLMSRLSPGRVAAISAGALGLLWAGSQYIGVLTSDAKNLDSRSALRAPAIDLWGQSPLVGHGPDGWIRLTREQVIDTPRDGAGGTHNMLLSTLVSGGVLAALCQVAVVLVVLWVGVRGVRRLRHARTSLPYACLVGALGAFVAQLGRGLFEATGWPGTRENDLRTWSALLMVGVVVTILTSATAATSPAATAPATSRRPRGIHARPAGGA